MNRKQLIYSLIQTLRETNTETIMLHQAIANTLSINVTDLVCIDFLGRFGPMPANKLAKLTKLTTGAITGVIDRLEKAGYAKRTIDKRDRRKTIIELALNKKTQKKLHTMFLPLSNKLEKSFSSYSDRDLTLLLEFLTKTIQISQEEMLSLAKRNK